jgi:beta-phosphoglucomutase
MTAFPATLFDFNGVLVDDELVHLKAFQKTLEPLGVALTEEVYWERYLGYDDKGGFRAILEDAGRSPSPEQINDLVEAKRPVYLELAKNALVVFPGAGSLVRRQAEAGPVAVVSGALYDEVVFGLEALEVAPLVKFIIASEQTEFSKPDPAGYVMAVERLAPSLGAERASRALVVEDSVDGIRAARAAGLTCVAVEHSYKEAQLVEAGAQLVVPVIADLTQSRLEALYASLFG